MLSMNLIAIGTADFAHNSVSKPIESFLKQQLN
jgi:hypothetical protein